MMRCPDVARELAGLTQGTDPADLRRHLAECPRCAAEAQIARRFADLWEATRPAEPDAAAWDRLWAGVVQADTSPATVPLAASRRGWMGPTLRFALIANAAAILIAAGFLLRRPEGGAKPPGVAEAPVRTFECDIKPGLTVFLLFDEENDRIVFQPEGVSTETDLAAFDSPAPLSSEMAQADLQVLNAMEGMEWPGQPASSRP